MKTCPQCGLPDVHTEGARKSDAELRGLVFTLIFAEGPPPPRVFDPDHVFLYAGQLVALVRKDAGERIGTMRSIRLVAEFLESLESVRRIKETPE